MKTIFCGICEKKFYGRGEYDVHRQKCRKELKPIRTTDRTHAQIVADAERTWLRPYLVGLQETLVIKAVQEENKVFDLTDFGFDLFIRGAQRENLE